jgi:hypothetical protein
VTPFDESDYTPQGNVAQGRVNAFILSIPIYVIIGVIVYAIFA